MLLCCYFIIAHVRIVPPLMPIHRHLSVSKEFGNFLSANSKIIPHSIICSGDNNITVFSFSSYIELCFWLNIDLDQHIKVVLMSPRDILPTEISFQGNFHPPLLTVRLMKQGISFCQYQITDIATEVTFSLITEPCQKLELVDALMEFCISPPISNTKCQAIM